MELHDITIEKANGMRAKASDFDRRDRADQLKSGARMFQEYAAESHEVSSHCLSRAMKRLAASFQDDAAYFARRARERLFELIGAAAEDEPLSMIGLLLIFGAIGFFWVGTPA